VLKNQKGSSIILISVCMVVMLSMTALVVDIGRVFATRHKLQNTADAAALAGAHDLPSQARVADTADEYIKNNGLDPSETHMDVFTDSTSVTVSLSQRVPYSFARIMGLDHQDIKVQAKCSIAPLSGLAGVRPLAVENFDFVYGEEYVLKVGGGDGNTGNYGAIALGDTGASTYERNLIEGYPSVIRVGDVLSTQPGAMTGPTKKGLEAIIKSCSKTFEELEQEGFMDSPRMITIPIIDDFDVAGRDHVTVVGFAAFYVQDNRNSGKDGITINGRFVKTITSGEFSGEELDEFGIYGVRLVQ
jgi:hypothetical protein